jgi:CRP/FNR family transcriptional regulator, cyclic AMP receptor protein
MASLEILSHEPDQRTYAPGETVFRSGDPPDGMFAVVEGEVEIRIGDRVVERIGPGGVFGEMALIDALPRSATAVVAAGGPSARLALIGEKRFLRLVGQTPQFALQIMKLLTERLRRNG